MVRILLRAIAVVLFGIAALSLWQLKRARRALAAREAEAARAADEDKLTGLPNHAKTLELLDLALAERADGDCTIFAMIESMAWMMSPRLMGYSAAMSSLSPLPDG